MSASDRLLRKGDTQMAQRGTMLGEIQVALSSGARRFWALRWRYKGPILAFTAIALLGSILPSADQEPDVQQSLFESPDSEATSAPSSTEATPSSTSSSATPTDVPPTATSVPPTPTAVPPTATAIPPTPTDLPPTATTVPPTRAPSVYYANCDEVRAAGAAPIYRGEPGYRPGLDRDNDGIACDT